MDTVAIALPQSVIVSPTSHAYGNICENSDSIVFKCKEVHMAEQLNDLVEVFVEVQQPSL
jgi:hypothetical protein